jgi:hypothetical protein
MIRYLFIHLEVQDGDRRHYHRILHTTKASNLNFAVERCVSTYWGYGKADKQSRWWNYGECSGRLKSFTELTKEEYEMLTYLFT